MNKKVALGLELVMVGFAAMQSNGDFTLVGILGALAAIGAIGAISSYVFTFIRKVFPVIDEDMAQFASLGFAVLIGAGARALLPYAPEAPAWVDQYLPYLVYVASQVWFLLNKDAPMYVEARERGIAYSMNH